MAKIKILRIINRFNLGGPTYNTVYLSKYLPDDYETLLIGGVKDDSEESSLYIAEQHGLNPRIIKSMHRKIDLRKDREAYKEIRSIISEYKPDIVHTHASKAGTLGRLAAIKEGVPVIVHTFHGHVFHSYFHPVKTFVYKQIERYLAKRSDAIIAISDKQKRELCKQHNIAEEDKVNVIPLGFDLDRFNENKEEKRKKFRDEFRVKEDEVVITIIGRLVPIKNHKLFLDALKIVLDKSRHKLRAMIVGDGESRAELEQHALDLGLDFSTGEQPSQLTFTSWRKDVDVVMSGSDIITLCSLNEGTPVSLIEAQANNKPVITTKVGGVENIIDPEVTGILLKDFKAETYAQALLQLTENKVFRDKLGSAGWKHVKNKFHYNRLVNDVDELYQKLLSLKSIN